MKKENGISLIALIITIIVIIILAAIVIGGIFNTPSQAKFSRWCSEIGNLQDAIIMAHGSRTMEVATDVKDQDHDQGHCPRPHQTLFAAQAGTGMRFLPKWWS